MRKSGDNVIGRPLRALCAVLLLGATVLGASVRGAQTPAPEAVVVDLAVTRNGKPMTGLVAADITVRDNGVAQTIELIDARTQPLDVVLVLDASASVRGDALVQVQAAARAAIDALRADDQAAILTFSQHVLQRSPLTADRVQLTAATILSSGQGSTALVDAASAALSHKTRGSRALYLFFSDGDDASSWLSAADVVRAAQRGHGVVSAAMIASPGHTGAQIAKAFASRDRIGADARDQIGKWLIDDPRMYRAALLPVLALETGGEAVPLPDTSKLAATFKDLIARHAQRYVVRFTPQTSAAGWHPLQIDIRGGGDVAARRGYLR